MANEIEVMKDGPRGPSTINLSRYLGNVGWRYDASDTFVVSGWRYACEARIAVRVPAPGADDTPASASFPPAHKLAWPGRTIAESELRPWPAPAYEFVEQFIPSEGGDDDLWDEDDEDDDDDDGAGDGDDDLGDDGDGVTAFLPEPHLMRLDDRCIASGLHHRVAMLPNVRYLPGPKKTAIYFRFDGGEGIVMPIEPGSANIPMPATR